MSSSARFPWKGWFSRYRSKIIWIEYALLLGCSIIDDASENIHVIFHEDSSMGKATSWSLSSYLNLIDPSHVLNIQNWDVIVANLILEIWRTVVSPKENHKLIIKNTAVFLNFLRILTWNVRYSHPFHFRHIERVVILKDRSAVSSEDDDFVAIGYHAMKGSSLGQSLFGFGWVQLNTQLCQWVVVFTATVTSKNIQIISNGTHRMPLDSLVRQIEISGDGDPLKWFACEVFSNVFVVSTQIFIGCCSSFFFGWSFFMLFVGVGCCDDDVVLTVELVGSRWIFFIY